MWSTWSEPMTAVNARFSFLSLGHMLRREIGHAGEAVYVTISRSAGEEIRHPAAVETIAVS
jgi:hypothetical protein